MHDLSPYECAKEFATHTARNIFITGKAGTGKTTFLRQFRAETTKQLAVVAPTGVAAVNAGGTTGIPEVRPSRSSRTKDRPSQISCAHGR